MNIWGSRFFSLIASAAVGNVRGMANCAVSGETIEIGSSGGGSSHDGARQSHCFAILP